MSAESELYASLKANSSITAVVGSGDAARIYPVILPEGIDAPSIVFQRVATEYVNTVGSVAVASKVTFDLFCVATEFNVAESLCNLAEAALYEKVSRSQTWDADSAMFAAVLTINLWPV